MSAGKLATDRREGDAPAVEVCREPVDRARLDEQVAVGQFSYTVRTESRDGRIIRTYMHREADEPEVGTVVELDGRQWRVIDVLRTEIFAADENTLVVEPIDGAGSHDQESHR